METKQINLLPTPIGKREAEKRAHMYVREKYGSLPSVGEPILEPIIRSKISSFLNIQNRKIFVL